MRLIVGGKHQGKLDYAVEAYGAGKTAESFDGAAGAKFFYGLQNAVADCLREGTDAEDAAEKLISVNPDIIIICDEIGCGIVPTDAFEREWRERTGRLCCALAKRAESVERVACGIAMRIK